MRIDVRENYSTPVQYRRFAYVYTIQHYYTSTYTYVQYVRVYRILNTLYRIVVIKKLIRLKYPVFVLNTKYE